jgi:MoaA/NifB/PqqE/SkfB family radical SAM enzyme
MARTFGMDALRRYLTLRTNKVFSLPIVILMPHSHCNCRCVMCDIWRDGTPAQQLQEADVRSLLKSLKRLRTRWVVMSGGEALMSPNLFRLTDIIRAAGIKVTLLSTGLLLKQYAPDVVARSDEVIVSLDGPTTIHNKIRGIPTAFEKLMTGVRAVKALAPEFPISGRCVIQRLNFAAWADIVMTAHTLQLDQISFLPADMTSEAFNRPDVWSADRLADVKLTRDELPRMHSVIEALVRDYAADFASGYIAESPAKIWRIHQYYAAFHNLAPFPEVKCTAPWVSAVVEVDGTVRPCFFHPPQGNICDQPLHDIVNASTATAFRRQLDVAGDPVCRRCVCSLNLQPTVELAL